MILTTLEFSGTYYLPRSDIYIYIYILRQISKCCSYFSKIFYVAEEILEDCSEYYDLYALQHVSWEDTTNIIENAPEEQFLKISIVLPSNFELQTRVSLFELRNLSEFIEI